MQSGKGSFKLFKAWGIQVYLHWSWLIVAVIELQLRSRYSSPFWNAAEYVTLFGIVLLHEFGHALACRQVGGVSEQIVLWPLGGIAYVNPPPRPGALLWSIAAGPLVNVLLVPVLIGVNMVAGHMDLSYNAVQYLRSVAFINAILLIFNILPIYPLDGGQIVRALLWFVIGRHRSLYVACVIGIIGAVGVIGLAIYRGSIWLGVLAFFMISQCIQGFRQGNILARLAAAPRHQGLACPSCGAAPLRGEFWTCGQCGTRFDLFETAGRCPSCGAQFSTASCPECQRQSPMSDWLRAR